MANEKDKVEGGKEDENKDAGGDEEAVLRW